MKDRKNIYEARYDILWFVFMKILLLLYVLLI